MVTSSSTATSLQYCVSHSSQNVVTGDVFAQSSSSSLVLTVKIYSHQMEYTHYSKACFIANFFSSAS